MNSYKRAQLLVEIYEKYTDYQFISSENEEIDLLRKHLIHDIRLVNAIISSYSQVENADIHLNSPISKLLEDHRHFRETLDKNILAENEYLSDKYSKNKDIFIRSANFYLRDIYTKYDLDEKNALDIISKITGISKERLKEAKEKKTDPIELERNLESTIDPGRRVYDFKTDTIYEEMSILLKDLNYEALDIEEKIKAIEQALKIYIKRVLIFPGVSDFYRDFEKDLEDLIQIMAEYSNNPNNVRDVTNYLVWIIGTLGKNFNIVWSEDLNLKDKPCIDIDRMLIVVHKNTSPVVVFKTIYERLFNIQYLKKDINLKIKRY